MNIINKLVRLAIVFSFVSYSLYAAEKLEDNDQATELFRGKTSYNLKWGGDKLYALAGDSIFGENLTITPNNACILSEATSIKLGELDYLVVDDKIQWIEKQEPQNLKRDYHFLQQLTNLTSLSLRGQRSLEAQQLTHLTNLTCLDSDGIKGVGICENISLLTNLTKLRLTGNKLCISGNYSKMSALTRLEELDLTRGDIGIYALNFEYLTNLKKLNLSYHNIQYLNIFTGLSKLEHLILTGNTFNNYAIQNMKIGNSLRVLGLGESNITCKGVQHIAKLTHLTHLDLHKNKISDQGAALLAKMPNLTYLDVENNQISDDGAGALILMTNLKELKLDGNPIGIGMENYRMWRKESDGLRNKCSELESQNRKLQEELRALQDKCSRLQQYCNAGGHNSSHRYGLSIEYDLKNYAD